MNEHFQEKLLEELQKRFPVIPSERDTHFQGAAKILMSRLNTEGFDEDGYRSGETTQKIIAQFAYDVVAHTILHIDPYHLDALDYDEIPPRIPDFTPQTPGSSPAPTP